MKIVKKLANLMIKEAPEQTRSVSPLSAEECYQRLNLSRLQAIEALLDRNGFSLSRFKSILDFGCRDGLKTRHFFHLAPNAKIYGCDVESDQIAKCRLYLPQGHFIVNKPTPPLDFPDEAFDFVFSFSVFTHLSEPNHISWLKELAHKLKPGGVMVHTTHGYECLKRLSIFNSESLEKYELSGMLDNFITKQLCYHYIINDPKTPEYGYTIISKDYILKNWENYSGLPLLEYTEGAIEVNPEGCHDLVLLAKDAERAY